MQGFRVSADFFQTLGVQASLGRTFLPDEAQADRDRVAVINERLWKRRFAEDPGIVGRTIILDGQAFTVIGVMPELYEWPMTAEIWSPLVLTPEQQADRLSPRLFVMGRVKPDIPPAEVQTAMDLIAARLERQYPDTNRGRGVSVVRLPGQTSSDITRVFLLTLMGAVSFVLLIACANVANLQIARTTEREKEIAIREALGARQWHIRRQLLTETTLLSLIGAAFGLVIALWGVDIIKNAIPASEARWVPGLKQFGLNFRGLGFTVMVAFLTGIVSGLAPALEKPQGDLNRSLRDRSATPGGARRRLRSLLVVGEVALALVLLVGTSLMVNGIDRLFQNQRQGIDPDNVLTMRVTLPGSKYEEGRQQAAFYDRVIEEIQTLPDVQHAGVVNFLPSSGDWSSRFFSIEGQPAPSAGERPRADIQIISDEYFQTMRIPLIQGRAFTPQDDRETPPVVVVSENLAQRFWPDQDPLGRRVRLGDAEDSPWLTVVGVVGNVKTFMFDPTPRMMLYTPHRQMPRATMSLVVRTTAEPMGAVPGVRAAIGRVDPDQPVYEVRSMRQVIEAHLSGSNLIAGLMGAFGFIALLLAAAGVYSVMAYAVSQRTHEIGVRMAVGAQPADVLKLIVKQGMGGALIGVGIGLIGAFAMARALSGILFGVMTTEPATIVGIGLLLTLVALAANLIPARRATRVDPIVTLRYE